MTFVLYSGVEKWEGPTCLHDMLDFTEIPVLIQKMIPDYKINVISIREIQDTVSDRAREIFSYIAPRYGIEEDEWNHDGDHIHMIFRAQPKSELSKFINAYKSASSRLLKKEFPEIRKKLWKETFWSQSFCMITAGGAPIEVIREYIETQGEKDGKE